MEARVAYGPFEERPRLMVVKDGGLPGRFSALPHDIIRRTGISRDARLLVAVLMMYGWQGSDITASHATLASDMGCSTRMLRVYLDELIRGGVITEHEAGFRRQKVYRLVSIGTVLPIETVNEKPASDSTAVNRKFSTVQSEISDTSNEKQASDSYKKTPEKKTTEEDLPPTGGGAADAAAPAPVAVSVKKSRQRSAPKAQETTAPETIPLTEQSYDTAEKWGYDRAAVDWELDRFLSKARAKGWVYVDWKAAFRTWLQNEVKYAARDGRSISAPTRKGAATVPPGAASKQKRDWSGFNGRYGSNLNPVRPSDGR